MISLFRQEGISYIIDTSGSVPLSDEVKLVLKNAQEVLLDLKFWDDASYLKFTGMDMKNTKEMLSFLDRENIPTVIRTVVVPDINDREEVLIRYLSYIEGLSCITDYELLGFHTMGFFKYEKLGIENPLSSAKALDPERLSVLQNFINSKRKTNG